MSLEKIFFLFTLILYGFFSHGQMLKDETYENKLTKQFLLFNEWVFAVQSYAQEVLRQERISSHEYFQNRIYQHIPGAHSNPGRYYKKEFKARGGWGGIFGRADNKVYKDGEWRFLTLDEWIEQVISYNNSAPKNKKINSISYKRKKLYLMIPGAPSVPADVYGEEFRKRGGWGGVIDRVDNKVYKDGEWRFLTLDEWIKQVIAYNEKADKKEKINSSSYSKKKMYLMIPGAPRNPHRQYGEEFRRRGGWGGVIDRVDNKVYKDGEWRFLTLDEWIQAVHAYPQFSGVRIKFILYEKLYREIPGAHSNPGELYREEFRQRGGWGKIFSSCRQRF